MTTPPPPETGDSSALGDLLAPDAIVLDAVAESQEAAIRLTGKALVDCGAVLPGYVEEMLARERSVSTWVGENIAFPHATRAGKEFVLRDAIAVVRFSEGVDWAGNDVRVAVGIAARDGGHIALLSRLATVLLRPEAAAALKSATEPAQVYELLRGED